MRMSMSAGNALSHLTALCYSSSILLPPPSFAVPFNPSIAAIALIDCSRSFPFPPLSFESGRSSPVVRSPVLSPRSVPLSSAVFFFSAWPWTHSLKRKLLHNRFSAPLRVLLNYRSIHYCVLPRYFLRRMYLFVKFTLSSNLSIFFNNGMPFSISLFLRFNWIILQTISPKIDNPSSWDSPTWGRPFCHLPSELSASTKSIAMASEPKLIVNREDETLPGKF